MISSAKTRLKKGPAKIKENLISQVNSKTLWEESVKLASSGGIRTFLEIGPGQVLKGLLKKIDPTLEVKNIGSFQDIHSASLQPAQ